MAGRTMKGREGGGAAGGAGRRPAQGRGGAGAGAHAGLRAEARGRFGAYTNPPTDTHTQSLPPPTHTHTESTTHPHHPATHLSAQMARKAVSTAQAKKAPKSISIK